MAKSYGLDWDGNSAHYPAWTAQPELATIRDLAVTHLGIKDGRCHVSLFKSGDKNMIYAIDTDLGAFIMRVGLPMDPLKVASEVATMNYVRAKTVIPVPRVIAYNPSNDGPLLFPWILMERVLGKDVFATWRAKSMEGKRKTVTQLAEFQCQLDRFEFQGIGSLINYGPDTTPSRLAFQDFHRYPENVETGSEPYRNAHNWLKVRLNRFIARFNIVLLDCQDDEKDLQWVRQRLDTAQMILDFLPRLFPPEEPVHRTSLVHADLHGGNIMIDDQDNITGIIDWEFQHTSPAWRAQAIPNLLMTHRRAQPPDKEKHLIDQDGWWHPSPEERAEWDGLNHVYWEELEDHQSTLLRKQYIDEMDSRSPGWKDRYEATKFHRMIDRELLILEYNGIGYNIQKMLEQYTGKGKNFGVQEDEVADEDKPCFNDVIEELGQRLERRWREEREALEADQEGDSEDAEEEGVEMEAVPCAA